MTTITTSSLKLPPIPVPRGRSPGSSPDVRRRSKEREQQRKLRGTTATFRLPRLFRGRSMSTTASYALSLTNLNEIAGAESPDDGCADPGLSSGQGSRKVSKTFDTAKWPVMKTLSAASAKQHAQQHLSQNSASSTPGGRRSPKGSSPQQATPTSLTAPDVHKPRSHSHSHKFPFAFAFAFGHRSGDPDQQTPFKNLHDAKGNWIGFAQRKPTGDGQPTGAWDNRNTFFTRARSADDILQLFVDDFVDTET